MQQKELLMAAEQEVLEAFSRPTPRAVSDKGEEEDDEESFFFLVFKKAVIPLIVVVGLFVFVPFLRASILIFFAVSITLLGIMLAPTFGYDWQLKNLIRRGDFAIARIVSIEEYDNYDTGGPWVSSGNTIRFEFSDSSGTVFSGEESLTEFVGHLFDDKKAGDSVIVVYPKGKPQKNQLYVGIPYKPIIPR